MKTFKQFTEEKKKCGEGEYYCFTDKKCKPIPKGYRICLLYTSDAADE